MAGRQRRGTSPSPRIPTGPGEGALKITWGRSERGRPRAGRRHPQRGEPAQRDRHPWRLLRALSRARGRRRAASIPIAPPGPDQHRARRPDRAVSAMGRAGEDRLARSVGPLVGEAFASRDRRGHRHPPDHRRDQGAARPAEIERRGRRGPARPTARSCTATASVVGAPRSRSSRSGTCPASPSASATSEDSAAPHPVRADRRHVPRAGDPARSRGVPAADRRHHRLHVRRRPTHWPTRRNTLTCRVHDECNGSDVFGSDICTCRPYLIHGIEECVAAGAGGRRRLIVYNRKEGRALGEVTKFLVYNARKRQEGGDRAATYFERTECVAGVQDARFQQLMPDVLHWLGITRIDRFVSMSNMKHDAMVALGHRDRRARADPGRPDPRRRQGRDGGQEGRRLLRRPRRRPQSELETRQGPGADSNTRPLTCAGEDPAAATLAAARRAAVPSAREAAARRSPARPAADFAVDLEPAGRRRRLVIDTTRASLSRSRHPLPCPLAAFRASTARWLWRSSAGLAGEELRGARGVRSGDRQRAARCRRGRCLALPRAGDAARPRPLRGPGAREPR